MNTQPAGYINFLFLAVMAAVFYFGLIRPQKKKEKEVQSMRESLAVGDEILTIGGIKGKIVQVKQDIVVIESSGMKTRIELMKWGVHSIVRETNVKAKVEEVEVDDKSEETVVEDAK